MVSLISNADVCAPKLDGAATSATPACLWKPCSPPYSTKSNRVASGTGAKLVVEYTVVRIVVNCSASGPAKARRDRAADVFGSVKGSTAFQAKTSAPRLLAVRRTAASSPLVMMPYRRPGSGPRTPDTRGPRQEGSATRARGAGAATAAGWDEARGGTRARSEAIRRRCSAISGGLSAGNPKTEEQGSERGTDAGQGCRAANANGPPADMAAPVGELNTGARRGGAPPPTPPVAASRAYEVHRPGG